MSARSAGAVTVRGGARGAARAAPVASPTEGGGAGPAEGRCGGGADWAGRSARSQGSHRPPAVSPGEKLSRERDATAAEGLRCPAPQPGASRGRRPTGTGRPAALGALAPLQMGSTVLFPTATVGGRAGQVPYRPRMVTCTEGKPQTERFLPLVERLTAEVFLLSNMRASLHAVSFHVRMLGLDVTNTNLFLYELFQGLSASLITNRQTKVFVCLKSNNVFERKNNTLY